VYDLDMAELPAGGADRLQGPGGEATKCQLSCPHFGATRTRLMTSTLIWIGTPGFGVRCLATNGDGRGFAGAKGSDGGWLTWGLTATALPMNSYRLPD
jgi:hypothetical protein